MSASHVDVTGVIDAIPGRKMPMAATAAGLALMAIGALSFVGGMAVAGQAYTWGAFLAALIYWIGISQGGVMFGVILTGTWGRWGRGFKRVGESFFFMLPVLYLFLLFFLVAGGLGIYPWNPDTISPLGFVDINPHSAAATAAKPFWFNKGFFIGRITVGLLVLMLMDIIFIRGSLRPDLVMASQRLGAKAPGWWKLITGGATDVKAEVESGQFTQSLLFGFMGIAFALVFPVLIMDLIMGLSPWWAANMFPTWVSVSSIWLSMATLGATTMILRDWLGLKPFIKPSQQHDLGRFILAGTMFWAYTAFAQLLPIYYANMPEETDYLLVRLMLPQWSWMARLVAILCFIAPFTINLSRGLKKMRWPFAALCLLIMTGVFFERNLLVMPQVWTGDDFPIVYFLGINLGIWLGFLGLFITVVGNVLARIPPLVISDPHLEPHPWDVHVHSLDAHPAAHH